MLTFVFDMKPSHNATHIHLEVRCPKRSLLTRAAWAANQDLVRGAILGSVKGKITNGVHAFECVSVKSWQETVNEYIAIQDRISSGSAIDAGIQLRFVTFEPDHIVVEYSIEEAQLPVWRPELFAH